MAREFLLLVQESAFKTPVTTPVVWPTASANAFYIRLDGANVFTMRPRPVMVAVPYGGGLATDAFGCDRASARDYAAFLGFFSLEPP
jgi:hypothetical protein